MTQPNPTPSDQRPIGRVSVEAALERNRGHRLAALRRHRLGPRAAQPEPQLFRFVWTLPTVDGPRDMVGQPVDRKRALDQFDQLVAIRTPRGARPGRLRVMSDADYLASIGGAR